MVLFIMVEVIVIFCIVGCFHWASIKQSQTYLDKLKEEALINLFSAPLPREETVSLIKSVEDVSIPGRTLEVHILHLTEDGKRKMTIK